MTASHCRMLQVPPRHSEEGQGLQLHGGASCEEMRRQLHPCLAASSSISYQGVTAPACVLGAQTCGLCVVCGVSPVQTYGTPAVEITPGPRLNLVLGPNGEAAGRGVRNRRGRACGRGRRGTSYLSCCSMTLTTPDPLCCAMLPGTGKSSLVCALCLGLTGAPKVSCRLAATATSCPGCSRMRPAVRKPLSHHPHVQPAAGSSRVLGPRDPLQHSHIRPSLCSRRHPCSPASPCRTIAVFPRKTHTQNPHTPTPLPAQLLGRADNIKDFIKRGADSGWVETTLSGGPGRRDSVIRCEMLKTAEGYTTRWKINGAG